MNDKPTRTLFEQLPPESVGMFQQLFSDTIPHNKALGITVVGARKGAAAMRLDWREELVGNPETGVIHGGAITALLDAASGMAVATMLIAPRPFATLDLRIDYVRPATPGKPVLADAECIRMTANVAFTRAIAHQGDPADPVASSAGTFMMATKGEPPESQNVGALPAERAAGDAR